MRPLPKLRFSIARLMLVIALAAVVSLATRGLVGPAHRPPRAAPNDPPPFINDYQYQYWQNNKILGKILQKEPLTDWERDFFVKWAMNRERVAYATGRWDITDEDVLDFARSHPEGLRRPFRDELPRAFRAEFMRRSHQSGPPAPDIEGQGKGR